MIKIETRLSGNITVFNKHTLETMEIPLENIGSFLAEDNKASLLNGALVHDRLAIIDMQEYGITFVLQFAYESISEKKERLSQMLDEAMKKIDGYIRTNYDSFVMVGAHLEYSTVYEKDYIYLGLQEAKADLTAEQLRKFIEESSKYHPTVI